jgi:hypothetical protein
VYCGIDTLTQRDCGKMALVRTSIQHNAVELSFDDCADTIRLPINGADSAALTRLSETCDGIDEGDMAAQWLSCKLGVTCRLMRVLPTRGFASVDLENQLSERLFVGQPLLIISDESVVDLNSRLGQLSHPYSVRVNRFRRNIGIVGCAPSAENTWRRIRIGAVELQAVEGCARCSLIHTDQETAERNTPRLLKELGKYRRQSTGIIFGHYFEPIGKGIVNLNDVLTVLE